LFQYACFLENCEKFALAEENYLQVLELDSNFVEALHAYGSFLQERGEFSWAEKFYDRIMKVKHNESLTSTAATLIAPNSTAKDKKVKRSKR
jgi:tetratricopeptide (TPR) repeat protein